MPIRREMEFGSAIELEMKILWEEKRADLPERANIAHDRPCERNLIVASDVVNATAERSGVNER